MVVLSREKTKGVLPALCCSWASAGVRELKPFMQHNLGNCCSERDMYAWLESCSGAERDQCLAAMLASSLFVVQALVRNRSR